jgi:peptide chain release factor 2
VFLFDLDNLIKRVEELDSRMLENDIWNDQQKVQVLMKESKFLKSKLEKHQKIENKVDEIIMSCEILAMEDDENIASSLDPLFTLVKEEIEEFRVETLLNGEYDKNNAIISIHSGSGGLDAQDWASMILRMYTRWAEKKDYDITVLDLIKDTEAGIKSVSLLIKGINAYGFLKSEKGVHRLVRISPFDSSGKRHTSFASVDVMPEIEDDLQVDINPVDLRIDTYRASGAGGQHINMTDSAVRITHLPTGVVTSCQSERSQHSNKATAMKMLIGKLIEIKEKEQMEKISDIQGDYSQITWGSQIRSYVFNPYNLVKDHRTNAESGNVQAVMDGSIDLYINEYLKKQSSKE